METISKTKTNTRVLVGVGFAALAMFAAIGLTMYQINNWPQQNILSQIKTIEDGGEVELDFVERLAENVLPTSNDMVTYDVIGTKTGGFEIVYIDKTEDNRKNLKYATWEINSGLQSETVQSDLPESFRKSDLDIRRVVQVASSANGNPVILNKERDKYKLMVKSGEDWRTLVSLNGAEERDGFVDFKIDRFNNVYILSGGNANSFHFYYLADFTQYRNSEEVELVKSQLLDRITPSGCELGDAFIINPQLTIDKGRVFFSRTKMTGDLGAAYSEILLQRDESGAVVAGELVPYKKQFYTMDMTGDIVNRMNWLPYQEGPIMIDDRMYMKHGSYLGSEGDYNNTYRIDATYPFDEISYEGEPSEWTDMDDDLGKVHLFSDDKRIGNYKRHGRNIYYVIMQGGGYGIDELSISSVNWANIENLDSGGEKLHVMDEKVGVFNVKLDYEENLEELNVNLSADSIDAPIQFANVNASDTGNIRLLYLTKNGELKIWYTEDFGAIANFATNLDEVKVNQLKQKNMVELNVNQMLKIETISQNTSIGEQVNVSGSGYEDMSVPANEPACTGGGMYEGMQQLLIQQQRKQ